MSDRENYFPQNTPIEQINDTLYTDYGFLSPYGAIESNIMTEPYKHIPKEEEMLEPPF